MDRQTLGAWGESLVITVLQRAGWQLIKRRERTRHGEVDIIMFDPARALLALIEVKTRLKQQPVPHYHAWQKRRRYLSWMVNQSSFVHIPYHSVQGIVASAWCLPKPGIRLWYE